MIVKALVRNAPVIGSAASFIDTAQKVYKSTSPSAEAITACKGIIIDCTPPAVKYPLLCTALACTGIACLATGGNPLAVSAAVSLGECIVEQALGS
jgi:hypothetical protein